jgi:hypothetical protein
MTNDETTARSLVFGIEVNVEMTNAERMPSDEVIKRRPLVIRHWTLVILWSFVIGHWSFSGRLD